MNIPNLSCNLKIVDKWLSETGGHFPLGPKEAHMSISPTEAPAAPVLTSKDRCDRCGARAFVLVVLKWSPGLPHAGELSFCAHDFRAVEEAIAPYVSLIIDERWTLQKHIADDKHVH